MDPQKCINMYYICSSIRYGEIWPLVWKLVNQQRIVAPLLYRPLGITFLLSVIIIPAALCMEAVI